MEKVSHPTQLNIYIFLFVLKHCTTNVLRLTRAVWLYLLLIVNNAEENMIQKLTEEIEFIKQVLKFLANDIKDKWNNREKCNLIYTRKEVKFKVVTNFYKSHCTNWLAPVVKTLPCNSCTVLDGSGVESRWGWDFPSSCTGGAGTFSGVKRPRRSFNHPSPSSAKVTESRVLLLLPLCAFMTGHRVILPLPC